MPQLGNRRNAIRQNISGKQGIEGFGGQRKAPMPGGARAPAPQAPPQPGGAAPGPLMPWDVAAANSEAAALTKRSNTLSGLQSNWLRTQQDFGLEGPWGDPASNPYSRSALLQRSYNDAKRGTTNSAGRRLYAGSFINNQNQNTHQFNLGRDELQKGYAEAQAQNQAEQMRAMDEYNEAIVNAGWDRVNAGLAGEPESMPAGPGPGGPKGPGKKSSPKTNNDRKAIIRQNINQPARGRR